MPAIDLYDVVRLKHLWVNFLPLRDEFEHNLGPLSFGGTLIQLSPFDWRIRLGVGVIG